MAMSVDANKLLDKAYEDKALGDVLAAPVDALAGVTAADAKLLQEALNIKTVADLGRNKYIRAAVVLVALSEAGAL